MYNEQPKKPNQFIKRLRQLDAQPYTIQLNYKKSQQYQSTTGGVVTLIFYLAAIVVLSINGWYFFSQNEFIFDQYLVKNDFTKIDLGYNWFGILLTASNETHRFNITNDQLDQYGLQVLVQRSDDTPNGTYQTKAVPCTNFTKFNFTNFFCFPQQFNLTIEGRNDVLNSPTYTRLGWIVQNSSSKPALNKQPVNLTVILVFVNNVTNPKYQVPINSNKVRRFSVRDGMSLAANQLQKLTLYFQKLTIKTDQSLLFFPDIKDQSDNSFYDQEHDSTIVTTDTNDDRLVYIKIKRSLFTLKYQRHYRKIPTLLAESFGVIGLISMIFLLTKGYNRWCFAQKELIPKQHQKKTNIFRYYLNSFQNLKRMTTSQKAYEQFQHNLDIHKILLRLDKLQARLRKIEGRSEIIFDENYQPQFGAKSKRQNQKNQFIDHRPLNQTQLSQSNCDQYEVKLLQQ